MKRHLRALVIATAFAILAAACSGGSATSSATPAATSEADATTPAAANNDSEPTATPLPEITDQQRIEAALAQLAADVDSAAPVDETIDQIFAYDVLDTRINTSTGSVTIDICSWTGTTVFDQVRAVIYTTSQQDTTATASLLNAPTGAGDCLNTTLINTALDHIDAYDIYWTSVLAEPASFDRSLLETQLATQDSAERSAELVFDWIDDGLTFERAFIVTGDVRTEAVVELLTRVYRVDNTDVLEIVVCRNMNPSSGAYRADVLVDDFKPEDPGPHAVTSYQLVAQTSTDLPLLPISGSVGLSWADCLTVDNWPQAANDWRPRDTDLVVFEP